jgi:hypothetical protein
VIYVDPLMWHGWKLYGRQIKSCHMFSDRGAAGDEELHALAEKIGLKRSWFQLKRLRHYDLTESRRRLAIAHGAKEIRIGKELAEILNRQRLEWMAAEDIAQNRQGELL